MRIISDRTIPVCSNVDHYVILYAVCIDGTYQSKILADPNRVRIAQYNDTSRAHWLLARHSKNLPYVKKFVDH